MLVFATCEKSQEIFVESSTLIDKFDYYFLAKPSTENNNYATINLENNESLLLLIKASLSDKKEVLISNKPINDPKIINKVKPKHHVLDNDEWIYLSPSIRAKIDPSKIENQPVDFTSLQNTLNQLLK